MKTALDYLQDELPNIYHSTAIELSDVRQAMEEYAQYKVNELNKSDVKFSSGKNKTQ